MTFTPLTRPASTRSSSWRARAPRSSSSWPTGRSPPPARSSGARPAYAAPTGHLSEGARLHRAIAGATGESLALQRLAELALYRGRRAEATALLDEALDVARVTDIGFHLLDRIYGTRIALAPDPAEALLVVEEAEESVRGALETCPGCRITFAVPAAIAAARAGDFDRVAEYEPAAEFLASVVMRLPAWNAALEEVRGHIARAHGDAPLAAERFRAAAEGFGTAGHPLDLRRCVELANDSA
jgi:hypothetical protein